MGGVEFLEGGHWSVGSSLSEGAWHQCERSMTTMAAVGQQRPDLCLAALEWMTASGARVLQCCLSRLLPRAARCTPQPKRKSNASERGNVVTADAGMPL